ncbi:helix-turn-helix transcriptional regulator [Spongiactinospora sp. TRM90649]|nr:helix-turn-helix transcriptional regulator [Spongiactinospora sp. TRM90649]MDF5756629.1 helix-turn-helix transcriptional regulator [Spongiactinospora sp. TRM90649]
MQAAAEGAPTYGLQICQVTGHGSGTVYPILRRLEGIGWVRSYWDESEASGPRRRLVEMTAEGRGAAASALAGRSIKGGGLGWRPVE